MVQKKTKDRILQGVLIISFLGILLAAYLTYGHYTSTAEFCIGGEKGGSVRCDVVNQSVYAEIFGVPVAGLGLLGYLSIFLLACLKLHPSFSKKHPQIKRLMPHADALLLTFAAFSIAMKLYFNYLQFIVLKTICVLCEVSALFVLTIFILLIIRARKLHLNGETIKKAVFFFIILTTYMSLFIVLSIHYTFYRDTDFDTLAKCLAEKNVEFFGTFWCPSCGEVKKTFGSAFQYITYVECDPKGENSQAERCLALNVEKYPTWIDSAGNRLDAETDVEKIAQFYRCPLKDEPEVEVNEQ